jgi:hypothetical protein
MLCLRGSLLGEVDRADINVPVTELCDVLRDSNA